MSGPKTSRYTLTAKQRRIIEEQRKIEQRKAIAIEKIQKYRKKLLQITSLFSDDIIIAEELLNRCGNDGGFTTKLTQLEQIIRATLDQLSISNTAVLSEIESLAIKGRNCLIEVNNTAKGLQAIASKNVISLRTDIESDIDAGFDLSFNDIQYKINKTNARNEEILSQLEKMKTSGVLPDSIIEEITAINNKVSAIDDEVFLKNYISVSVKPLLKKCSRYIEEYNTYKDEYEQLFIEYTALCKLYCLIPQEYNCTAESVFNLRQEVERIKNIAAKDDEQSYISNCIDEVMVEMGYKVIGSREFAKKSGTHFHSELFSYSEGTAVNVTYSSDGKIAMELGGLDTTDRLPDEYETAELCEQMETFCDDFIEFEKRLAEKGVVLSDRISLMPAESAYAQIINTDDYNMRIEASHFETKKRRSSTIKSKSIKVDS